MGNPLISCIMPSRNERWFHDAVNCFYNQRYQQKELIIVGTLKHMVNVWNPGYNTSQYKWVTVPDGLSIGELRNIAIRNANGSIIAHWDDDDWDHPDRLKEQVNALIFEEDGNNDVVGYGSYSAINEAKEAWVINGNEEFGKRFVAGGSFMYLRELWENFKFSVLALYGEDTTWGAMLEPALKIASIDGRRKYVARLHSNNTSPKAPGSFGWTPTDYSEVVKLMKS